MIRRTWGRPVAWAVLCMTAWLGSGACSWGDEGAIRSRLEALADEANKPPAEGLALVAHAASMGDHFTDDATVDLGPGTSPIEGREMLIGMVARLQPRTAAYQVRLEDADIRVADDGLTAGVGVTVSITPRRPAAGEGPDAREFALTMRKADGTWRIARITAVQTLR
jgi:hypothetical protein